MIVMFSYLPVNSTNKLFTSPQYLKSHIPPQQNSRSRPFPSHCLQLTNLIQYETRCLHHYAQCLSKNKFRVTYLR